MSDFLEGVQIGASALRSADERAREERDRTRDYRQKLAAHLEEVISQKEQLAYERAKDKPYTPEEEKAVKDAGGTLGRTAGQQATARTAEAKATADIVPINDIDKQNYKTAYGRDIPAGMTSWHKAQQKEVADLVKDKMKPAAGAANAMDPMAKEQYAQDLASGKLKGKNLTEVFGRGSPKDRGDVYLRARTLNPSLSLAEGDIEYMAGTRKAQAIAGVQGAEGQKIGAVTASMGDMIEKARPLIAKVSPSTFQTYNGLVQAGKREFNNPDLLAVDTYLTSAAGFYASLQKNGGTPDSVEREAAKKILSAKLSKGGFDAVAAALTDEGNSRVKRIKENQSATAPGSATKDAAPPTGDPVHDLLSGHL